MWKKSREEYGIHEITCQGTPINQLTKRQLLKLVHDMARFPNVNHVSFGLPEKPVAAKQQASEMDLNRLQEKFHG